MTLENESTADVPDSRHQVIDEFPANGVWARGMGDFLVEAHEWLRAELAALRDRLDRDGAVADLGEQLRAHCRTFCSALTEHHAGEDRGAFPLLAQRFPALAPALAELGEQHREVDRMQAELGELVRGYYPGRSDPDAVRAELDRLAAELEAHFRYEERTIVAALNSLGPAPGIG
ncbi:hemerythrin domain-containing protein [Saccharopolyspora sp. NFXS83]|uniref:hemerythrin domain-containing protein n=1 Tax=Saccharopolyspora sp. NFXS83 TaxID=2993560 RepID=UPI00224AA002|nr:hemerythrin domain-containing protein [Saccharopolyspora sp. NFXS83]MCX2730106.1 hemerythrin domain-containing protein [Saccharopolyspora sp. NFXS83]